MLTDIGYNNMVAFDKNCYAGNHKLTLKIKYISFDRKSIVNIASHISGKIRYPIKMLEPGTSCFKINGNILAQIVTLEH